MLERVAKARREDAAEITLSTDPADGHPLVIEIDWHASAIDGEECYEISGFVPMGE